MNGRFERVVVPLDSASEIEPAIDTAARLAARWQVPLHGIFIEDEELLGLAGLPFGAQVSLGAGVEKLSKRQIERHLRAFAERVRKELAAAAAGHHLKWSFAVIRGPLPPDLFKPGDFVVVSAATRPIGGHFRVRARWWSAISLTRHPLLLARRRWELGGSVLTLLRRRGAVSARLLALAAEIADLGRREMTVLSDIACEEDIESWVNSTIAGHALALKTETGPREPGALKQRVVALDCRLLVSTAEGARPDDLREIVEGALCDLLVIGEEGGEQSVERS
jgi:hypothetical protein